MRFIKLFAVCLFAVVSSNAMAIDPTDEDVSYIPNLIEPGYGYDKTTYRKCVLKNSKKADAQNISLDISEACRDKATPKKCRALSPMLADTANAKSPQQICVETCKSAWVNSSKNGDCSLN